jgi:ParB-like chromosome segregation protein Spo0J
MTEQSFEFYEHAFVNVDELIPYAMNSRTHSDAQVAQIAASIREFGFTNPVLIDEANNLIAGHGRVLAARKLKMEVVPAIIVTGLDENRRRALVIADNQLALNAEWDQEKLVAELQSMSVDMQKLTGFSEEDLLAMLNGFDDPNFAPGTEDDQGKLDEFAPKMVTCPHCQAEWDLREHGQG